MHAITDLDSVRFAQVLQQHRLVAVLGDDAVCATEYARALVDDGLQVVQVVDRGALRLRQGQGQLVWQTNLIDRDVGVGRHGTAAAVVDALAVQVGTWSTLLALETLGNAFHGPTGSALHVRFARRALVVHIRGDLQLDVPNQTLARLHGCLVLQFGTLAAVALDRLQDFLQALRQIVLSTKSSARPKHNTWSNNWRWHKENFQNDVDWRRFEGVQGVS